MYRSVLCCLLACAFVSGSKLPLVPRLNGRIIGGVPADITQAPYTVSLLLNWGIHGEYYQACGGSIIKEDVVVTAAQCPDETKASQWKVRAGSTISTSGGQLIEVSKYIIHSKYDLWHLDYDVALYFLASPLEMNDQVSVVALPTQGTFAAPGDVTLVTGWGSMQEGGNAVNSLRKVKLPIVEQSMCAKIYSTINPVTDRMLCAGYLRTGEADVCHGDIGGPMTLNGVLIGIPSWGFGCGRPGYPGVFTRVSYFSDWVDEQMLKNNDLNERILNGLPVEIEEVPYQACLLQDFFEIGFLMPKCGGTIIADKIILTAASCLEGTRPSQWKIRVGSSKSLDGGQLLNVSSFLLHPQYNNLTKDYDIALMYSVESIIFDRNTAIATLPVQNDEITEETTANITGWGGVKEGWNPVFLLLMTNVSIVNQQKCIDAYKDISAVTERMICAASLKNGGKDSCAGDEGGPLSVNGVIVGITSWGKGCGHKNYPGVYTRVASFRQWIDHESKIIYK